MWLGGRDEICVVGDPRQTIYSFTGATPSYLTGFPAEFPSAPVIRLVRNYRSTPQVVTLANKLVAGTAVDQAPLVAQRPGRSRAAADRVPGRAGRGRRRRPAGARADQGRHPGCRDRRARCGRMRRPRVWSRPWPQLACRSSCGARSDSSTAPRSARPLACCGPLPGRPRRLTSLSDAKSGHILASIGLTPQPPGGRGIARERWESLEALAQLAADFFAANPQAGLDGLAAELAVRSAIGHVPAMAGRHAGLAARGQGPGVAGRLPAWSDRRHGADHLRTDRRGDRGGAPAAVCGRHQGTRAALPLLGAREDRRAGAGPGSRPGSWPALRPAAAQAIRPAGPKDGASRRGREATQPVRPNADDPLFRRLREWRLTTSKEQSLCPPT